MMKVCAVDPRQSNVVALQRDVYRVTGQREYIVLQYVGRSKKRAGFVTEGSGGEIMSSKWTEAQFFLQYLHILAWYSYEYDTPLSMHTDCFLRVFFCFLYQYVYFATLSNNDKTRPSAC